MKNIRLSKAEIKVMAQMLVTQQRPALNRFETRIVEVTLPFKESNNTYIFIFTPKYRIAKNNYRNFIAWKQKGIIIINDFNIVK